MKVNNLELYENKDSTGRLVYRLVKFDRKSCNAVAWVLMDVYLTNRRNLITNGWKKSKTIPYLNKKEK